MLIALARSPPEAALPSFQRRRCFRLLLPTPAAQFPAAPLLPWRTTRCGLILLHAGGPVDADCTCLGRCCAQQRGSAGSVRGGEEGQAMLGNVRQQVPQLALFSCMLHQSGIESIATGNQVGQGITAGPPCMGLPPWRGAAGTPGKLLELCHLPYSRPVWQLSLEPSELLHCPAPQTPARRGNSFTTLRALEQG